MGSKLTAERARTLLRAACGADDVSSAEFVRALSDTLLASCSFDVVGLLLRDGPLSLRLFALPREPSRALPLPWAAGIAPQSGSLTSRLGCGSAHYAALVETDPLGALLISSGLRQAAFASISYRWATSGLLFVASVDPVELHADLDLMTEAAQVVGTIRGLVSGADEQVPFARLEQLDTFATLGRLAGGLVHEVNNPATFIALAAGQIEKALARNPSPEELAPIASLVQGISDSTRQMRSVVSDFQLLSSGSRHAVSGSLDFERFLRACITLTTVAYRTKAKVELQTERLPACPASFASLGPVVVNLLLNAIESIPAQSGETHTIAVKAEVFNEQLHLTIRDSGNGMAAEDLARVFEPFFTGRQGGHGAGLGLTLARETVRRMRGDLQIESAPDHGTCVAIVVPLE